MTLTAWRLHAYRRVLIEAQRNFWCASQCYCTCSMFFGVFLAMWPQHIEENSNSRFSLGPIICTPRNPLPSATDMTIHGMSDHVCQLFRYFGIPKPWANTAPNMGKHWASLGPALLVCGQRTSAESSAESSAKLRFPT